MSQTQTRYEHVVLDEAEVPRIDGTRYKVIHLVEERLAYGWSPEELQFQHPDLTLGQVYSALAYYADHSESMDETIRVELAAYDEARASAAPSPLLAKLRAKGLRR